MANTVYLPSYATGRTVYMVLQDESGDVYNWTTSSTFTAINTITDSNAGSLMTEQGTEGQYRKTTAIPATVPDATYRIGIRERTGASFNLATDPEVAAVVRYWDGTNLLPEPNVAITDVNVATIEGQDASSLIDARIDNRLQTAKLDKLLQNAVNTSTDIANSSFVAMLLSKSATPSASSYNNQTDSLEAIADDVATGGGAAPTVEEIRAEMDTNSTQLNAILADTNEVQTSLTTGGVIHSLISDLPTTAQVNAQVVDALNVDTYAEPGQGSLPATASLVSKIGHLYKFLRNRKTNDATSMKLYNDDGTTVDHKANVSSGGGASEIGEWTSGP